MSNAVKAYKVKNLSNVDVTWYKEGDIFITDTSVGVLHKGTIKTIGREPVDLSDYAKKEDIPDVTGFLTSDDLTGYAKQEDIPDVPDVSNFVTAEQVQQMIDEALTPDPEGE